MVGYGIDFGTTNSIAAVYSPGESEPITALADIQEGRPHPSVVWYRAGAKPVVGHEAKRNIHKWSGAAGNAFVSSIKRRLGQNATLDILGEEKEAWEIASDIFAHLLGEARSHGKEIHDAVVTIPVRFDGRARRDLRQAADYAGLHISTFVHEPFAAVVGHLCKQNGVLALEPWVGKTVLVFDWGGGTLDITVARVTPKGLVELSTRGLPDKSGDYFDELVQRWSRNEFLNKIGLKPEDIRIPLARQDSYLLECENAKRTLSEQQLARIELTGAFRSGETSYDLSIAMTREQFEGEVEQTVNEAAQLVAEALESAHLTTRQIDEVLLIGGTSRIPLVYHRLHDMFGARLTRVPNADTIIAEGAAIVAALGMQPFLSRTIAISLSDGTYFPVFEAGMPAVPDACQQDLAMFCTDNRDGWARLVVAESTAYGEPARFQTKKVMPIRVSPNLRKPYVPERVAVRFALNDDLVLEVSGKGATQVEGNRDEIEDLCFGLTLGGR